MTHDTALPDHDDDNKLTTERREKLAGLRAQAKAAGQIGRASCRERV